MLQFRFYVPSVYLVLHFNFLLSDLLSFVIHLRYIYTHIYIHDLITKYKKKQRDDSSNLHLNKVQSEAYFLRPNIKMRQIHVNIIAQINYQKNLPSFSLFFFYLNQLSINHKLRNFNRLKKLSIIICWRLVLTKL